MSAVSSGASSRPVRYGGQWKLNTVRSAGAVTCEIASSRRLCRSGSSSSRYVCHGRAVRPAGRDHLEAVDVDDPSLRQLDEARALDDLVDLELVVVARAAEDTDAGARKALLGHPHPLVDRLEHLLLEQAVPVALVLRQLLEQHRVGAERVVAAADDPVLERGHLLLGRHVGADLEQRRVPVAVAVVDDRDEGLAGHVAAEHEHVGLVVLCGVEELAPAGLGAVHVRGEVDPHLRVSKPLRAADTSASARRPSRVCARSGTSAPPRSAPAGARRGSRRDRGRRRSFRRGRSASRGSA